MRALAAVDLEAVVVLPARRPCACASIVPSAPFAKRTTAADASSTVTLPFFFGLSGSGRSLMNVSSAPVTSAISPTRKRAEVERVRGDVAQGARAGLVLLRSARAAAGSGRRSSPAGTCRGSGGCSPSSPVVDQLLARASPRERGGSCGRACATTPAFSTAFSIDSRLAHRVGERLLAEDRPCRRARPRSRSRRGCRPASRRRRCRCPGALHDLAPVGRRLFPARAARRRLRDRPAVAAAQHLHARRQPRRHEAARPGGTRCGAPGP